MTPLLALALAVTAAGPVLTLDEALAEAQRKNLDLKAARARLEQAEQSSRKAWAGYLPTLAASGSYTRNSAEARITLPTRTAIRDVGTPTSGPTEGEGSPTTLRTVDLESLDITIQPYNLLNAQLEARQALIVPQLWASIRAATQAEHLAPRPGLPFTDAVLPALMAPDAALAHTLEDLHETVGTAFYWIIGLHIAASLYHHFLRRDDTLRRMT